MRHSGTKGKSPGGPHGAISAGSGCYSTVLYCSVL